MDNFNTQEVIQTLIAKNKIQSSSDLMYQEPIKVNGLLNLDEVMYLIHDLLQVINPNISFLPAYPDYLNPLDENGRIAQQEQASPTFQVKPTITYFTIKEETAGYGKTKQPFDGYKSPKERDREIINLGDKTKIIRAIEYDSLVKFEMWDLTQEEVAKLYTWFKRLMVLLRPYIMQKGIVNMYFWSGGIDKAENMMRNKFYSRSFIFYFRTQDQYIYEESNLNTVSVETTTSI